MADTDSQAPKDGQGGASSTASSALGEVPERLKPAPPSGDEAGQGSAAPARSSETGAKEPLAAPAPSAPEPTSPPVAGTPYARALELHGRGTSREDIATALAADGVDAASVKVVLNSLPNATMPSKLPELKFDQGVNALAPELLSVLDMGMEGKPVTVALYWLTFGALLAVFITVMLSIGKLDDLESTTTDWAHFGFTVLPLVGYPLSGLAILRALWLLFRRWL